MSEKKAQGSKTLSVVQFQLNNDNFLVRLEAIFKIISLQEIFALPETADFLSGVINYSGEIIPVVDLKKLLKIPDLNLASDRKIILVKYQNFKVGFLVDRVVDAREIATSNFVFDSARVRESDFIEAEYIEREESWPLVDLIKVIETYKANR